MHNAEQRIGPADRPTEWNVNSIILPLNTPERYVSRVEHFYVIGKLECWPARHTTQCSFVNGSGGGLACDTHYDRYCSASCRCQKNPKICAYSEQSKRSRACTRVFQKLLKIMCVRMCVRANLTVRRRRLRETGSGVRARPKRHANRIKR